MIYRNNPILHSIKGLFLLYYYDSHYGGEFTDTSELRTYNNGLSLVTDIDDKENYEVNII
jgi:hypothetical protein